MKALLFLYFLSAGITWVAGETGQGISGRLAIGELVLVAIIGYVVVLRPGWIRVSRAGRAALVMFLAFSLGVPGSGNIRATLVEWLIHGFVVVGFIVLYSVVARMPFEERLDVARLWVRAATVLAVLGLYEFMGLLSGLPSLLTAIGQPPIITSGLVGTFRNTGQAGVFFGTALVIAIPLHRVSTGVRRTEGLLSVILLLMAVAFTVKRSAIVGVAVGGVLLLLLEGSLVGRIRNALLAVMAAAMVSPVVQWMLEKSPAFRGRIEYKLGTGAVDVVENFTRSNYVVAIRAFTDNPLTGAGLGGIIGVYDDTFEIHSTYLGVLATTGLVGMAAYLFFMFVFLESSSRARNPDPRARVLGRMMLPLLLGLAVSFAYTNQLRKREFWITAALSTALMAPTAAAAAGRGRGGGAARAAPPRPAGEPPPAPLHPRPVPEHVRL